MFSSLIINYLVIHGWNSARRNNARPALSPLVLLLVLGCLFFPRPVLAGTWSWNVYQRQLSPAAGRLLMTVQSLTAKKKEPEALAKIKEFYRIHPHFVSVLLEFMTGNLHYSLKHFFAASSSYRRVIELAPDCLPAWENLGMVFLSREEYRQAAETFSMAVSLARKNESDRLDSLLKYAGTTYLMAADYGRALPFIRELVEQRQAYDRETVQTLVKIYLELKQKKAAGDLLVRVLDRYPGHAAYWRLLGQVRLDAKDYPSALAAYKVLASMRYPEVKDLKITAQLYRLLGVPRSAAQMLVRAGEMQTYSLTDHDMEVLVDLYVDAGDNEEALNWLKRRQARYPSPRNLLRQGEILFQAARYKESYDILRRLAVLPEKQGYQFLLAGYCAWYADDLPAAKAAFSRASHYEPYRCQSIKLITMLERMKG